LYGDCRRNEIFANSISDGYSGVELAQEFPIKLNQVLLSPQENSIHHNNIFGMRDSGIDLGENVDLNLINHNNITLNADGIDFYNCGENNKVVNNNIHGNTNGARAWGCKVNVTYNWWGSADGPRGIGHGTGDPVIPVYNATMTFDPWLIQAVNTESTFLQLLLVILRVRLRSIFT
jgi:hypothetical protein